MRRKSIRKIPAGGYCYQLLKYSVDDKGKPYWATRLCPYFTRKYDKRYRGKFPYCKYINDFGCGALDDQCKECGIKMGEDPGIQKAIENYNDNQNTQ